MHVTIQHMRPAVRALLTRSILIVLAAVAAVALGPPEARSADPEIVARVNGEAVTRDELQRVLAVSLENQIPQEPVRNPDTKGLERKALRMLIHRQLILQEAGRRNLTVTEPELDQGITALRRRFEDLKEFGVWMKERGLDDRSLFEAVRTEMLAMRVSAELVKGVQVTKEQVREYYETHKKELNTDGDVRLRIIAVKEKAAAEEIIAALKKGENFADLARKRSLGLRAAQGGDTGWVNPRTLPSPLREAVGTLKDREIGGPMKKGEDFLIIGLVGRRPPRTKSLDEARPEIERRLLAAKQEEVVQAWLAEQEKKSKIEVLL